VLQFDELEMSRIRNESSLGCFDTWQCPFCIRRNEYVIQGYHHMLFLETYIFYTSSLISSSGTIAATSGISSPFHPEISDRDTCLAVVRLG
jgi:hypothetical protein